jgi:FlaG/FlaF family flagellin (archaellin)
MSLMVALVVRLAAVVGTFALSTFDAESSPTPAVAFTYESDEGAQALTVREESGSTFESATVEFEQADGDAVDASPSPDWPAEVDAGDAEALGDVESDDTVRVVRIEPRQNGKTATIATWAGPDA